jgi:hypothetical protein
MTTRPIQNSDLKVTKSDDWIDSKGRQRVHISLKGASFINQVFWIHPEQMAHPKTLETVKTTLQRRLQTAIKNFHRYLAK